MPIYWNPSQVLDLLGYPEPATCSGTNGPTGRRRYLRCANPINQTIRPKVASKLAEMARMRPEECLGIESLRALAKLALCIRNHQDQVEELAARFQQQIRQEAVRQNLLRRERHLRHLSATTRVVVNQQSAGTTTVTTPAGPQTVAPQEVPAAPQTASSGPQPDSGHNPVPTPTPPPEPTLSLLPQLPPSAPSQPVVAAPTQPTFPPTPQLTPAPPPSTAVPPSASTISNGHREVVRKPLPDDCPICYEPMEGSEATVYCRRQCGTNVHRECMEEWRKWCFETFDVQDSIRDIWESAASRAERRLKSVTCAFCRQVWQPEPEREVSGLLIDI